MKTRQISNTGFEVTGIGLGCMGLSGFYGAVEANEAEATLLHAVELGVTHFDTADVYGDGHNEELIGRVLKPYRNKVKVATKFGLIRNKEGQLSEVNGHPDYVKACCDKSLSRLNLEQIDLYYLHRIDPKVPIEETVAAMAELVKKGKIQFIGLSGSSVEQLKRAHQVHPITAVQVEYSLWSREPEQELLTACEELGIGLVAYSPLGRGFLSGKIRSIDQLPANDPRRKLPRFTQEFFNENLKIADVVIEFAKQKGCTPAQVALAWLLAKSSRIAIIPGTRKRKNLEENVNADKVILTKLELEELNNLIPPGMALGGRYPEHLMKLFNFKE
jgi:aryl-alcohol dehydrogenase-like predicted oxidoreductase